MIDIKVNFSDLITEKRFAILQNRFYWYDIRYENCEIKANKPVSNFSINIQEVNEKTGETNYKGLGFEEDFLTSKISSLAEINYSLFLEGIKRIYTKESKNGFAQQFIEDLRITKQKISDSDYLSKEIIDSVIEQIIFLENRVSSYLETPYPSIKEKIEFNWSNTDVIFFFHLLRENKVINNITDADLGRIIDTACKGLSNKASDTYLDIKYSSKLMNNFKNGSRSDSEPLKRLKEIFSKNDFFNI